jgi:hypothetical protein
MGATVRRFLGLLDATGEITADEVDEEAGILHVVPYGTAIATITSPTVGQTITLGTLLQRPAHV